MRTLNFLRHHHVQIPFTPNSSLSSISKPAKLLHALKPFSCSSPTRASGRQQKQQQESLLRTNSDPQSSRRFLKLTSNGEDADEEAEKSCGGAGEFDGKNSFLGTLLAALFAVCMVCGFGYLGYVYRGLINELLMRLSGFIEGYGPAGYALFVAIYAGLEILAIPAFPLTMTAGLLFGTSIGTIIVSISGIVAATIAFLIARYFARERILKLVEGNEKFLAIDKAIGQNGFRVVTLLRMSPLLPFSLGNYLYGLTSVRFIPYILGSWLGMLPGTWAYVSAGAFGRAFFEESGSGLQGRTCQLLTLGMGLLTTALATAYVTCLAKDAVRDVK